MARSLNKVQLIGNLTRDPELRYTPQGTAVATIGLATNRQWKSQSGETQDEAEYHRLVVWDKLAEICAQMLKKGKKAYFEGRLQTRKWKAQDGTEKQTVEIVVSDMLVLDPKRDDDPQVSVDFDQTQSEPVKKPAKAKKEEAATEEEQIDQIDDSDIPF